MKHSLLWLVLAFFSYKNVLAEEVHFITQDKAVIFANFQQGSSHAVLLAHGAIFNKDSWGAFEQSLLQENYSVLAIDFRGYSKSTRGEKPQALYEDILAGVKFLRKNKNIETVTVLGASMGGAAAAKASVYSEPGSIDQLILLSPAQVFKAESLQGNLLFIASKDEYLMKNIRQAFERSPEPKQWLVIPGNAHAQHIFKTRHSKFLTDSILNFLKSAASD